MGTILSFVRSIQDKRSSQIVSSIEDDSQIPNPTSIIGGTSWLSALLSGTGGQEQCTRWPYSSYSVSQEEDSTSHLVIVSTPT